MIVGKVAVQGKDAVCDGTNCGQSKSLAYAGGRLVGTWAIAAADGEARLDGVSGNRERTQEVPDGIDVEGARCGVAEDGPGTGRNQRRRNDEDFARVWTDVLTAADEDCQWNQQRKTEPGKHDGHGMLPGNAAVMEIFSGWSGARGSHVIGG